MCLGEGGRVLGFISRAEERDPAEASNTDLGEETKATFKRIQAVMSCWHSTQTPVMTSNTSCLESEQLRLLIITDRGLRFICSDTKDLPGKGGQNICV